MAIEILEPIYSKLNGEIVSLMQTYISDSKMCKIDETDTRRKFLEKAILSYIKENPIKDFSNNVS